MITLKDAVKRALPREALHAFSASAGEFHVLGAIDGLVQPLRDRLTTREKSDWPQIVRNVIAHSLHQLFLTKNQITP